MKESEIRPKEILDQYLALSKIDADNYFSYDDREKISCVACDSLNLEQHLQKVVLNINYVLIVAVYFNPQGLK